MKQEIYEKLSTMSISAFGLAVALAWNNVIQKLFAKYYENGEGVRSMIFYACSITVIGILVTAYTAKTAKKIKKQGKSEGRSHKDLLRMVNQL
jgi:Na+/melibiose symporter-like transporter